MTFDVEQTLHKLRIFKLSAGFLLYDVVAI